MPKFSIIVPLYNKERDVATTLNSLLLQTFTDFEVVVMNDGSTDNSELEVKKIQDDRIRYFSKQNEGVSRTRNLGVAKATAHHVVFLDADDYWYPNHLDNLNNLILKFPEAKWYATAYEKRHNSTLTTPMRSPILEHGSHWKGLVSNYFENSLVDTLAWTSAVCFKKSFFDALDGFDTAITHGAGEDTDLWLRAALKAPLAFSNTITARHNLHCTNRISHTPTLIRNFMDLDGYQEATAEHPGLKQYLDLNRFSFAIQHKMANDPKTFRKFAAQIDPTHLTRKQRYMLKQPKQMLKLLVKGKDWAERLGFRISSFD